MKKRKCSFRFMLVLTRRQAQQQGLSAGAAIVTQDARRRRRVVTGRKTVPLMADQIAQARAHGCSVIIRKKAAAP